MIAQPLESSPPQFPTSATGLVSAKQLWTGKVLSVVPALFLLVDAIAKLVRPLAIVQATTELDYPVACIDWLGVVLLTSTVLYLLPRTSILGAILLTGYFDGAVATHVRVSGSWFNIFFPVLLGILLWAGLALRDVSMVRCFGRQIRQSAVTLKPNSTQTTKEIEMSKTTSSTDGRNLVLNRLIDAPPSAVYAAWTTPDLLEQFFAPQPFITKVAELDVRTGGVNAISMQGPDGSEFPARGVYLEVVPNRKLVFTDAYESAWKPSTKPFMTVTLTFGEQGGKTNFTAFVQHWTEADREAHEQMGFHQGWSMVTEQLAKLVEA